MASTFTATGTISNLTRVELEQLRRADFFSNGKALTIGDSALSPEGVVGKGDVNAEPYLTSPSTRLDDVYSNTLPNRPGPGLSTLSTVGAIISETVKWFGPTLSFDGSAGFAAGASTWQDHTPALNFTLFVQPNDVLLIKPRPFGPGDQNANVSATVSAVGTNTLTLTNIVNPSLPGTVLDFTSGDTFSYVVVRPNAVQLFAVPGSGPVGREQTFLMVSPASTLHSNLSPTLNQINTDRITNIVPSTYAVDTTVDRADSVFNPPAVTRTGLDSLGYRVVLYPDNGTGTAPDLSTPIAALNPVIDPAIAADEQRMTFDYKAGIVRFSVAPALGGDIKKGVNPTTGRLSLYAVYWAVDTNLTAGSARYLHATRSTDIAAFAPGEVRYDSTYDVWRIGSTVDNNEFVVAAHSNIEAPGLGTRFGALDLASPGSDPKRYFAYRSTLSNKEQVLWGGKGWTMRSITPNSYDPTANTEVRVGSKHEITIGDGTAPPQGVGDFNPQAGSATGYRLTSSALEEALLAASTSGYGVVHARKGRYYTNQIIVVPPGVELRGEGSSTVFMASANTVTSVPQPIFRFGPNTTHGVYDFGFDGNNYAPKVFTWVGNLEGYDVVWNPTRRVWGIVQGDPTTNEVWFNEVNLAGEAKYPGLGIPVKNSVAVLFTSASLNSSNHTPGHYPRIAHHYPTDEYAVVWVEEYNPGTLGPRVALQVLQLDTVTDTHTQKWAVSYPTVGSTYKNHPSVAVDNQQQTGIYGIAIGYWAYNLALTTSQRAHVILSAFDGVSVYASDTETFTSQTVVSSTDVASDDVGNFCFALSRRAHPILYHTTGSTSAGNPNLTDLSANFTTLGVLLGTRYIHLPNGTGSDNGRSGTVIGFTATNLTIRFDNVPNEEFTDTNPTVTYALAPPCQVNAVFYDSAAFSFTSVRLAGALALTPFDYQITEREPDFVRISHGEGQYLVAYQTFDTNGYLSRNQINNFDNSIDTGYLDQAFGVCRSPVAHRQHIATCYCVLDYNGRLIGPSHHPTAFDPTLEFAYASQSATTVTRRSLGGRGLNIPYPNLMSGWGLPGFLNESRLEMEVSARNYTQPWSATLTPSLIPDVTWTGSDWVIVSPSVSRISSDTGTYIVSGLPYLSDPTFFFGNNSSDSVQGWFLHRTVNLGDQIYFPTLGVTRSIISIPSEHVVQLASTLAVAPGTTNIPWVLIRGGTYGVAAGIKNPGYRVSSKGEVVVAGEFFTFAESPAEDTALGRTTPRVTETLNRTLWGDANFVGSSLLTGTLPKYGSNYISWNDTITTSKVATDVTYRAIGVGAPKGCNGNFTSEQPMVAIAWAENFFGYLDRHVAGASDTNETAFFRQSFGPWNSGLSNLSLVGPTPVGTTGQPSGLKVLTKEHVFTRHGYHMSGQPYFATDGYRNMFSYVAFQHTRSSYPFGNVGATGSLNEEGAYYKNVNSVYTDAVGRDPLIFRGPPLGFMDSPRELIDTLGSLGGAVAIKGNGIRKVNPAAPKVIWNGKRFMAFVPTVYSPAVPLGNWPNSQPTPLNAPAGITWPRYRAILNMVAFAGDESLDSVNEALQGNVEQLLGAFTANIAANAPKLVANTVISVGGMPDFEQREVAVLSVAYSGRVYCVVWSMGYNVVGAPGANRVGGSTVGYTLFPDTDGNSDPLNSGLAQGVQSFVIASDDFLIPGDRWTEKARMLNPHVVWDGKHFLIGFQYLDDNLGAGTGGRWLRVVKVNEQGPGGKQHVKALSANTRVVGGSQTLGIRKNAGVEFLGIWDSSTGLLAVRGFGTDTPFSTIQAMPGDMIQITGVTPASGTADAVTTYNGFYLVNDTIASPGGVAAIDLGTALPITASARVHGILHSGGFGGDILEAPDGAWSAGINNKSAVLFNPSVVSSTDVTLNQYVNRLFGVAYNENRGEYVFLAECELTGVSDRRLRLFSVKQSTMTIDKEVDVTTPGTTWLPAALGWNGDKFLVVHGLDSVTVSAQVLNFTVVSQDLVVEQSGLISSYEGAVWTSGSDNKAMPGPGYGFVDTTINMVPMLTNCHVEWNGKLNRWVVSASYLSQITGGPAAEYTTNYREKRLANRAGFTISSWSDRTLTLAGSSGFRQRGARAIISRENTIYSGLVATRYGGDPTINQNEDNTIYDTGVSFVTGGVVANGDQVQLGTPHQKPRVITAVAESGASDLLTLGGSLKTSAATLPSLAVTYSVEERGRTRITSVSTGTVNPGGSGTSSATMRSSPAVNFVTAGVKVGHEIILQSGAAAPFTTARSRIINISTSIDPNDTLTFDTPITFVNGAAYVIRKNSNIYTNIRTTSGAVLTTDVSFSELGDPTQLSTSLDQVYFLPREDVFVWTLGYNTPAVQIRDADGVYLDNVDIGGHQDIEERLYHMSRPVRRRGGPVFGQPDDGMVNSRAPTDYLLLRPTGKVSTLRLNNVRSRARSQFGDRGTFRSKP